MKTGIELITEERQRQIDVEGWTREHNKQYKDDELYTAGLCYYVGFTGSVPIAWPFPKKRWKPTPGNKVRDLIKAGALFKADAELYDPLSALHEESMRKVYKCAKRIDELLIEKEVSND